jgi:hypothetical protein
MRNLYSNINFVLARPARHSRMPPDAAADLTATYLSPCAPDSSENQSSGTARRTKNATHDNFSSLLGARTRPARHPACISGAPGRSVRDSVMGGCWLLSSCGWQGETDAVECDAPGEGARGSGGTVVDIEEDER